MVIVTRLESQLQFQKGRHAKRWGKVVFSFGRKEGRVFFSSGKGGIWLFGWVIKGYLASRRSCREVGGWRFSSLKEGVADGERGCHLYVPNLLCV